jgi:4-aminobutyrate aminotransferase-like enzyme
MRSRFVLKLLKSFEARSITHLDPDGTWPIVWERAKGNYVWDANGHKYLDLTAAFGVAAAGHANGRVIAAAKKQMAQLLHAMGDVHPHPLKAKLARELSRITFERWRSANTGKTIFCNSGFEAVETALKTAMLATRKPGVIAFSGGYHGLGYGALTLTHRDYFRRPFESQLGAFGHFMPFPEDTKSVPAVAESIEALCRNQPIGAIVVEPIQGRGGINIPAPEFLPILRDLCDRHSALLVADEIFTGFGRTGRWFGCEHGAVVPDVICLGKALTGGFPLSACVGKAELMDNAWPSSRGEALHTSTFLGHPVGCAMALANIIEIRSRKLVQNSHKLGARLLERLQALSIPNFKLSARGIGLMAGLEVRRLDGSPAGVEVWHILKAMLRRGFIMVPEGEHGNVLSFTPPLTMTAAQLERAVDNLQEALRTL